FTGADLMRKIFAQAPIPAQPAEGPFHHPPTREHHKPLGGRGPTGNLQAPPAGLLDPGHDSLVAPSGPNELQAAPAVVNLALDPPTELRPEPFATRALGAARTIHYHQQPLSQDGPYD